MGYTTTIRQQLNQEIELNYDSWDNLEGSTLTDDQLDKEIDYRLLYFECEPFTVWTKSFVYFPVSYDGQNTIGSVSRNPNGKTTIIGT
jgi:YD repeat-containing protein